MTKKVKIPDFLLISDIVKLQGITKQAIHKSIKDGYLKAERHGKIWVISQSEYKRYYLDRLK